ncbi:MAG: alpha/beta hydrolase [Lachnospiraceae bacterium]|nr:alpha/beta hydrolase [Lachnospiraceae bacterium]
MIHETYQIALEGSRPDTKLVTYLIETSPEIEAPPKPLVLICPGGGYSMTSDREAEAVALKFNAAGFHAAVLRYSCAPAVYPTALCEVAYSVALIRKNAVKWNVNPDKIVVQGASAGGHLAASYAAFYKETFISELTGLSAAELRPAGLMLSYPVITSGTYAHKGSFECLLGKPYEELQEEPLLQKLSLENAVHEDMPKTFLWHTFSDDCVPVENSLLFVNALKSKNIPTEFHMFPVGVHGLGLANHLTVTPEQYGLQPECEIWIDLAITWLSHI